MGLHSHRYRREIIEVEIVNPQLARTFKQVCYTYIIIDDTRLTYPKQLCVHRIKQNLKDFWLSDAIKTYFGTFPKTGIIHKTKMVSRLNKETFHRKQTGTQTKSQTETQTETQTEKAKGIFVYGTLRPDFTDRGDKWGICSKGSNCISQWARLEGFKLYQDMDKYYPYIVPSSSGIVYGYYLSWPKSHTIHIKLKRCDEIEGYDSKKSP